MIRKLFKNPQRTYTPDQISEVLAEAVNDANLKGSNKGVKTFNIPCAFDIETTSFYRDLDGNTYDYQQTLKMCDENGKRVKLEKCAIMYIWQLGINGRVIIGRTWEEFIQVCNTITSTLNLSSKRKLIIYVHNLAYEFQFIRELFEWSKVFSIDLRKPIYATTKGNIEFRCSYLLSGYSLKNLSKQLRKYKVSKMDGDLDYTLLRHSKTPLTDQELQYCINDVIIVMCYIQELIENNKDITRLPLTKTGFVRQYCKNKCLRTTVDGTVKPNWGYIEQIRDMTISGVHEFDMLQRAFAGGFTHANANYTDQVIPDVDSYDFTSSYPYVMVAEQFPMSRGVEVPVKNMEHFNELTQKYCCVFDIEFTNIFASVDFENSISISKCILKEGVIENNGRVVGAKRIITTITEVDFMIIKQFYKWDKMRVGSMYCYKKDYLPTEFVESILKLYQDKTELKGVEGKEVEYLNSKEMLNSCYGMTVTNPLKDEFTYEGEWDVERINDEEKKELLFKYNTNKNRFLFYAWGIYVTAYARRNLFTGIYQAKDDYIYSDTDSLKIKNGDKHKQYFEVYNSIVVDKLKKACKYHGLDFALCSPKTIEGEVKMLGVWDYEGRYRNFKTLGAKRYMVECDDALRVGSETHSYSLTVSGVNKNHAIPYLINTYGTGIFDAFTDYLTIPETATGKNIHTYIDYSINGEIMDYRGEICKFVESTGVHLEPTGYSLSLSVMYINYLRGIKLKT